MPIYRPPYEQLLEAITSVCEQTYQQWELHCLCDDGSGQPALTQALEALAHADPRIKLMTLPHNQGIAAATNRAIEAGNGEYVTAGSG